jgi:hypothetical protein
VLSDVIFEAPALRMEQGFEAIDLLLELAAISHTEARFLPFFVDTFSAITGAPATSRLCAVAFDLPVFTELAASRCTINNKNGGPPG